MMYFQQNLCRCAMARRTIAGRCPTKCARCPILSWQKNVFRPIFVTWCILMPFSVRSGCLSGTPCTRVGRQAVARQFKSAHMKQHDCNPDNAVWSCLIFMILVHFLTDVKLHMQYHAVQWWSNECVGYEKWVCGRIPLKRSKRSQRERYSRA